MGTNTEDTPMDLDVDANTDITEIKKIVDIVYRVAAIQVSKI
jgi:hypothetical protein